MKTTKDLVAVVLRCVGVDLPVRLPPSDRRHIDAEVAFDEAMATHLWSVESGRTFDDWAIRLSRRPNEVVVSARLSLACVFFTLADDEPLGVFVSSNLVGGIDGADLPSMRAELNRIQLLIDRVTASTDTKAAQ